MFGIGGWCVVGGAVGGAVGGVVGGVVVIGIIDIATVGISAFTARGHEFRFGVGMIILCI